MAATCDQFAAEGACETDPNFMMCHCAIACGKVGWLSAEQSAVHNQRRVRLPSRRRLFAGAVYLNERTNGTVTTSSTCDYKPTSAVAYLDHPSRVHNTRYLWRDAPPASVKLYSAAMRGPVDRCLRNGCADGVVVVRNLMPRSLVSLIEALPGHPIARPRGTPGGMRAYAIGLHRHTAGAFWRLVNRVWTTDAEQLSSSTWRVSSARTSSDAPHLMRGAVRGASSGCVPPSAWQAQQKASAVLATHVLHEPLRPGSSPQPSAWTSSEASCILLTAYMVLSTPREAKGASFRAWMRTTRTTETMTTRESAEGDGAPRGAGANGHGAANGTLARRGVHLSLGVGDVVVLHTGGPLAHEFISDGRGGGGSEGGVLQLLRLDFESALEAFGESDPNDVLISAARECRAQAVDEEWARALEIGDASRPLAWIFAWRGAMAAVAASVMGRWPLVAMLAGVPPLRNDSRDYWGRAPLIVTVLTMADLRGWGVADAADARATRGGDSPPSDEFPGAGDGAASLAASLTASQPSDCLHTARRLLHYGTAVDAPSPEGLTALSLACSNWDHNRMSNSPSCRGDAEHCRALSLPVTLLLLWGASVEDARVPAGSHCLRKVGYRPTERADLLIVGLLVAALLHAGASQPSTRVQRLRAALIAQPVWEYPRAIAFLIVALTFGATQDGASAAWTYNKRELRSLVGLMLVEVLLVAVLAIVFRRKRDAAGTAIAPSADAATAVAPSVAREQPAEQPATEQPAEQPATQQPAEHPPAREHPTAEQPPAVAHSKRRRVRPYERRKTHPKAAGSKQQHEGHEGGVTAGISTAHDPDSVDKAAAEVLRRAAESLAIFQTHAVVITLYNILQLHVPMEPLPHVCVMQRFNHVMLARRVALLLFYLLAARLSADDHRTKLRVFLTGRTLWTVSLLLLPTSPFAQLAWSCLGLAPLCAGGLPIVAAIFEAPPQQIMLMYASIGCSHWLHCGPRHTPRHWIYHAAALPNLLPLISIGSFLNLGFIARCGGSFAAGAALASLWVDYLTAASPQPHRRTAPSSRGTSLPPRAVAPAVAPAMAPAVATAVAPAAEPSATSAPPPVSPAAGPAAGLAPLEVQELSSEARALVAEHVQVEVQRRVQRALAEERETARAQLVQLEDSAAVAQECAICMDAPRTHAFLPCLHRCVCIRCARDVMRSEQRACPVCREWPTDARHVFV